ncbi:MAG: hypothetical protein IJF76_03270 [Clostridia bacterium]|nr:hypothetical protein [Clostridia bacterium]
MDYSREKFDVIILAGQSNAEGGGMGDEQGYIADDRVLVMRGDFSATVKEGEYGNQYLDLNLSPNYYVEVAKNYEKDGVIRSNLSYFAALDYANEKLDNGRKVLIVQTAIGGTGFAKKHWGVGDILHARMVDMVNTVLQANPENRIVGLLWHQGEHDSFENEQLNTKERKEFYYDKLNEFIKDVRGRWGDIPFICAGFTKAWYDQYPTQCKAIYDAIDRVINSHDKAYFIKNTFDLKNNKEALGVSDEVHFCNASLKILGHRYYDALKKFLD